jgi:hypothetical protein
MKRRHVAKGRFGSRYVYNRVKARHKRRKGPKNRVSGQDVFGHGK